MPKPKRKKQVKRHRLSPNVNAIVCDLVTRLNTLDDVCRREIGRLSDSHRAAMQRIDRLTLAVFPAQPLRGEMICVVCKKRPPNVSFTYETPDGQLCESCWVWHENIKQRQLQQGVKPRV